MKKYNVAIVGASGAVGQELIKILEERNFPVGELKLCATTRSAGKELFFRGKPYVVEVTTPDSFNGVDIALFAGGSPVKNLVRQRLKEGQ